LTATAVSTWQAVRARDAERTAATEASIARAVNDFLQEDLLGQVDSAPAKSALATFPSWPQDTGTGLRRSGSQGGASGNLPVLHPRDLILIPACPVPSPSSRPAQRSRPFREAAAGPAALSTSRWRRPSRPSARSGRSRNPGRSRGIFFLSPPRQVRYHRLPAGARRIGPARPFSEAQSGPAGRSPGCRSHPAEETWTVNKLSGCCEGAKTAWPNGTAGESRAKTCPTLREPTSARPTCGGRT